MNRIQGSDSRGPEGSAAMSGAQEPLAELSRLASPVPAPMPVDAEQYAKALSLTTFVNAYYQIRDTLRLSPRRVLVIGMGTGIEPLILRHKFGLDVTTFDIDDRFRPDVVGSVHDMAMFAGRTFDVVIASHVLEHLAFSYLEPALREIARVGTYALVYLPFAGRHLEWRFVYSQRLREYAARLRIPPLRTVSGERPELQEGQHYWECGMRGFSVQRIERIMSKHFTIVTAYQNDDWKYSMNFVLASRAHATSSG